MYRLAIALRIRRVNTDRAAPYKIAEAVAFGDFLTGHTLVQAADIGIAVAPGSSADLASPPSSQEQKRRGFLRQLCGRSPLINVLPYARWMSRRSHRNLLHDPAPSRGAS